MYSKLCVFCAFCGNQFFGFLSEIIFISEDERFSFHRLSALSPLILKTAEVVLIYRQLQNIVSNRQFLGRCHVKLGDNSHERESK
jgi:hypothetical protein